MKDFSIKPWYNYFFFLSVCFSIALALLQKVIRPLEFLRVSWEVVDLAWSIRMRLCVAVSESNLRKHAHDYNNIIHDMQM